MLSHSTEVEDGGLGRHIAVHDTEFFGVGRPGDVMDWSLLVCFKSQLILHEAIKNKEVKLTQFHTRVKATVGAEQVQSSFSVVTLASPVNLSLCKHKQSGSMSVPLQLDLVTFEEALLRHRRTKLWHMEHFNCSGLSLLGKAALLV